MIEQLTDVERRTLLALAAIQPTTLQLLALRVGYRSPDGVVQVVNRLRAKGLIAGHRSDRARPNHSRSLRVDDGVVVTERGFVGRWVAL